MQSILLSALIWLPITACNPAKEPPPPPPPVENPDGTGDEDTPPENRTGKMKITVGSTVFTATVATNATTTALRAILPLSVTMGEMNGNEKYYNLPGDLPTAATRPGNVRQGEIMLFGTNTLVLFYRTFSTPYRYTAMGALDNPSGLESALGRGSVHVKFEWKNE